MTETRSFLHRHREGFRSALVLLGAAVLLVFSNGRWIVPLAAWVAPILVLRYFRSADRVWKALLFTWLLLSVTAPISWFGLWPFPPQVMAVIIATGSLIALIPYLADRLTRGRIPGAFQTLVFPCMVVTVDFLGTFRSGTTWGNPAYTQTENLALLQLVSVTGIWGISFLIAWLAPVANNLWEEGLASSRARAGFWAYAGVLGAILLLGTARLVFFPPSAETVRVATVSPPEILDVATMEDLQLFQQIMTKQRVDLDKARALQQTFASTYDQLFAQTRAEARAGARVVAWPEASLISFDENQDNTLIQRARQLAADEGIYLFMTIALVPLDTDQLNRNRVVLLGPTGDVLDTYFKTYTVPVVEEPFAVRGSGTVALRDTPHGRFAAVICYDMDSPRFLRGAGRQGADILFAPSGDWPAIKDLHSRMALVRAVEQGFSLVRPANHGLNLAADYQGRVLARMDHFKTSERQMPVLVPTQGVQTPYSRLGDTFAWTCLAGCILLLLSLAREYFPRVSVPAESAP